MAVTEEIYKATTSAQERYGYFFLAAAGASIKHSKKAGTWQFRLFFIGAILYVVGHVWRILAFVPTVSAGPVPGV